MRFITSFNHLYLESSTILYTHIYERRISLGKSFGKRFLSLRFSLLPPQPRTDNRTRYDPGGSVEKVLSAQEPVSTGQGLSTTVRSLTSISVGTVYAGFTAPRSLAETNTHTHARTSTQNTHEIKRRLAEKLCYGFYDDRSLRCRANVLVPIACHTAARARLCYGHCTLLRSWMTFRGAEMPQNHPSAGRKLRRAFFCAYFYACGLF